ILVSHRVAEARQQPLLVTLHDRPIEVPNRLSARLLESQHDLRLILRVEAQVRFRLKEIAATDQDGHLATFGLAGAAAVRPWREGFRLECGWRCRSRLAGWRWSRHRPGDR